MASTRRKAPGKVQPVPVSDVQEIRRGSDDTGDENDREAEIIAAITAAAGEDSEAEWQCHVGRVVPGPTGRQGVAFAWIFTCQPLELLTVRERLAAEVGAGRFRVRVIRGVQLFKQYDILIELTPAAARAFQQRNRTADQETRTAPAPAAAAAPAADPTLAAILAAIQQQSAATAALVAQLAQQQNRNPLDSAKNMIETLAAWQALIPKAPDPADIFEKAMSIAERLAGAGAGRGETGLLDLAREMIPAFTQALAKQSAAPVAATPAPSPAPPPLALAPRVARPANAPAVQHAPPAATPPAPVAPGDPALEAAVQQLNTVVMPYLLQQAAAGVQPNLVSDWLGAQMPPAVWDYLEAQADPVATLAGFFPAVNTHRAWFVALIESLYEPDETMPAGQGQQHEGPAAAVQPAG